MDESAIDDFARGERREALPAEDDGSGTRANETGNGSQQRRLAMTIGTKEADLLALIDGNRDPMEDLDITVSGDETINLQVHGTLPYRAGPDRPRRRCRRAPQIAADLRQW